MGNCVSSKSQNKRIDGPKNPSNNTAAIPAPTQIQKDEASKTTVSDMAGKKYQMMNNLEDSVIKAEKEATSQKIQKEIEMLFNSSFREERSDNIKEQKSVLARYAQPITRSEISKIFQSERRVKPTVNTKGDKRFKDLKNLYQMIEQNLSQSELIEGKDIAIILGATGVGKSTTINYLLGKKLVWSKTKNQTKSYVYETEGINVAQGDIEAAKIGTKQMESQTKTISVYPLHSKADPTKQIFLCDTPGLLDSQGSIVDIANQVGIVKALEKAQSIKVLLLIGYKNLVSVEGKGKLMKEVIDLYSKLIRDYQASKESVLIGFTHLNKDSTVEQISNSLKAMTDASDEEDQKIQGFLDVAIANLDSKSKLCALIKPLSPDNRNQLVEQLFSIKQISQEYVKDNFTYALASNTKNEFQLILTEFTRDITGLFTQEEYDPLTERLDIIKLLKDEIDFIFVRKCYTDSIIGVTDLEIVKRTQGQITRIPQESIEGFGTIIENITRVSNYLGWADGIKGNHPEIGQNLISLNDLAEYLTASMEACYIAIDSTDSFKEMAPYFERLYQIYFCKEIQEAFKINVDKLISQGVYKDAQTIKSIYRQNYYKLAYDSAIKKLKEIVETLNDMQQFKDDLRSSQTQELPLMPRPTLKNHSKMLENRMSLRESHILQSQNFEVFKPKELDIIQLDSLLSKIKELQDNNVGKHLQINSSLIYSENIATWEKFFESQRKMFDIDYFDSEAALKQIPQMRQSIAILTRANGHQRLISENFPRIPSMLKEVIEILVKEGSELVTRISRQRKLSEMENPVQLAMQLIGLNEGVRARLQDSSQALFAHLGTLVQNYSMKFDVGMQQLRNALIPLGNQENNNNPADDVSVLDIHDGQGPNITSTELRSGSTFDLNGNQSEEQELMKIEKKVKSLGKRMGKMNKEFFLSFKFFSSLQAKAAGSLDKFLTDVIDITQREIARFTDTKTILRGLYILQLCAQQKALTVAEKSDEPTIRAMAKLVGDTLTENTSEILSVSSKSQIPATINEEFAKIEGILKRMNAAREFAQALLALQIVQDDNEAQIQQQIRRIDEGKEYMRKVISQNIKANVFDVTKPKTFPADYNKVKLILDQFQKLKQFKNVNSLLNEGSYEKTLAMSIDQQQHLIDQINAYLQDSPDLPQGFSQETALRNLESIREAGILYKTHFVGKLENPADYLQNELQLKQKGLDKKVKAMLKSSDLDSVIDYMKQAGEGTQSYKDIKKYLKQKVIGQAAQISAKLEERNFIQQDSTQNLAAMEKLKEEMNLLESAAVKLQQIQYRSFKPQVPFTLAKESLCKFQLKQLEKFRVKANALKIEKASQSIATASAISNEFSKYLTKECQMIPNQMKSEMKTCIQRSEDIIDINNKQPTIMTLTAVKNLSMAYPNEFSQQEMSLKKKVNKQILDSALKFANDRVQSNNFENAETLGAQLVEEYSSILQWSLGQQKQQHQQFLQPVLQVVEEQANQVDSLFKQRKTEEIVNLINTSKSAVILKRVIQQYEKACDGLFDEVNNKNYSSSTLRFLASLADGTRSYQYGDLKQKYLDLQHFLEQTFIRLQNEIIECLNLTLSDSASEELPGNLIGYAQFSTLVADFRFTFINHEPFFIVSCQIFDGIQQRLSESVKTLDSRAFISYLTAIDQIEQASTQFEGRKANTIDVYRSHILSIKGSNPASASLGQLKQLINSGFWTISSIQQQLLAQKNKEVIDRVSQMLQKRSLGDASTLVRRFEDFSKKISSSLVSLDSNGVLRLVQLKYTEKAQEAKERQTEERFDSKLFNLIEELSDIERCFEDIIIGISKTKASETIVKNIEAYIENIATAIMRQNFEDESDTREFVQQLINIRRIGFEIGQVHESMLATLSRIITTKFQTLSPQFISDVSSKLRQDKLGLLIIQENSKNFEGLLNKMIEEVSKDQFSLEYVNSNIKGDNFIKEEFTSQYKTYEQVWKELLTQWQQGSAKPADILQKTKLLFKKFNSANGQNYLTQTKVAWSTEDKRSLVIMLAHISVFWSVVNCQRSDDSFRKLHPVQVSTIMRLLSIDTTNTFNTVENHLVQVKTGEGKSIILGITSCFLGLLGFCVDCCCYSSYLSGRDFSSFESMFESFEIGSRIKYSTFDKQFEDIINDPKDMRQMGLDLIEQKLKDKRESSTRFEEKRRILLIDEVDFFFGEDFLGRTYPVALYYSNADVIAILKFIWENRSVHINEFKKTEVYRRLFQNNPNLEPFKDFIDERIKMMYEDVNDLESHRYLTYTPSGKSKTIICYKSLDGISFNTVKGYKTAFAYISEWEKRNITEEVMNENLAFIINVGCFSFAQIPSEYALVLGVSGTLEDMSDYQKRLTKDLFNIKKLTVSPSIYGASKFSFNQNSDVLVKDNRVQFHKEIANQIESVMQSGRAIIAFFDNKKALDMFKSELVTSFETQILSEETNFKGHAIVKAGSKGMITLSTKPFGRGCDFISTDSELNVAGGIHVIQTFLSEDLAEETQIKGRTARQSQKGSFSIVINKEDLVKVFSMPMDAKPNSYQALHSLRLSNQMKKESILKEKLMKTLESHKESMELKQLLLSFSSSKLPKVMELMMKFNKIADRTENRTNLYNFYSDFAGKIGIFQNGFEYDEHHNPKNVGLGSDGSFSDKSILIGLFYSEEGLDSDVMNLLIPVLKKKGFKVCDVITKESEFIPKVPFYDQVWVISGYKFSSPGYERKFQDAIEQHTRLQKGLMIWADNNPYIVHANLILQRLPIGQYRRQPIHIKLDGSDYADQILKAGSAFEPGQFAPHLITTGINNLHEGITICYPEVISNTPPGNFGALNIIGLSSSARPCFFVLSGTEDRGRIVFDCGFTKLMKDQWNTAGTVTYVTNCYAWLYWKERLYMNA